MRAWTIALYTVVAGLMVLALIFILLGPEGLAATLPGSVPSTIPTPVAQCTDGSWVASPEVCLQH